MQINRPLTLFVATVAALLMTPPALSAGSSSVRTDHLTSTMIAEATSVQKGRSINIGLLLEHDRHWHTYWRNPGDSGLPTKIDLQLPTGVSAGEIQWPAPYRFDVESIVNFGYGERQLLPIALHVGPEFSGDLIEVRASASWLICEVECIPGRADYRLDLPVSNDARPIPENLDHFSSAKRRLPQPLQGSARFRIDGEQIQIDIKSAALPGDIAAWEVFPAAAQVIRNGAYPMWTRIAGGMRMSLPLSEYFVAPPTEFPLLLTKGDQAFSITALSAARGG